MFRRILKKYTYLDIFNAYLCISQASIKDPTKGAGGGGAPPRGGGGGIDLFG